MINKVLLIVGSVSEKNSLTAKATEIFIENYKTTNPNDQIEILNLNNNQKTLSILNSHNFNNFYDDESDKLIEQLKSSNKIIIAAGMINFSVPTTLKSYFDNVLQVNKTFKYKYQGNGESIGLLDSKTKVQLILAQGAIKGWYPFASFDNYLIGVLKFMGITNVSVLLYDGTKTSQKARLSIDEIIDKKEIIELSNNF